MKIKYSLMAMGMLLATTINAQETYENAKLVDTDLNGTARYVGMGGALDALGADLSVISSNPAGLGLINRSHIDVSFGFNSQQGAKSFANRNATNASFDQAGFVYSFRDKHGAGFNFAMNFHKSTNFNSILSASGLLNGASQNTLSFIKAIGKDDDQGASTFNIEEQNGVLRGTQYYTSQLDNLYYNNFTFDKNGLGGYNVGSGYLLNRASSGYIGIYDIAIAGSINNQFFVGFTAGIHSVHYRGISAYSENLLNKENEDIENVQVNDERKITGSGVDMKLGLIFLPVKHSPFRIGLSIATPTFYSLTTSNATTLTNNTKVEGYQKGWYSSESYNFKLYTPWKFGLSAGHTIGSYFALGASYEYADYGSMKTRVNTGSGYDYYYNTYYDTSENDVAMNNHTKRTLNGVHTFKLGAEYRPINSISLRAGYNYISPMYNEKGYKDGSLDSYGSNYSSATDYVNWKATNRFTLGFGYTIKKFNIDLAYQYSEQKGDFYPFMDAWGDFNYVDSQTNKVVTEVIENYADAVQVKNNRRQLLLTLGYRF